MNENLFPSPRRRKFPAGRHAGQQPPFPGPPEEEALKLACHEYFTVARPVDWRDDGEDLFTVAPARNTVKRKFEIYEPNPAGASL